MSEWFLCGSRARDIRRYRCGERGSEDGSLAVSNMQEAPCQPGRRAVVPFAALQPPAGQRREFICSPALAGRPVPLAVTWHHLASE
jgi:hypothetical protein